MGIEEDIGFLRSEVAVIATSTSGIGERITGLELAVIDSSSRASEAMGMVTAQGERIAALEGALEVVVLDEVLEDLAPETKPEMPAILEPEMPPAPEPEPDTKPEPEPDTKPDTKPKSQHWLIRERKGKK